MLILYYMVEGCLAVGFAGKFGCLYCLPTVVLGFLGYSWVVVFACCLKGL